MPYPPQGSAAGGISDIVEDLTPQLGGDLDCQDKAISDIKSIAFNDGDKTITEVKDEDDIASNSDVMIVTQQGVKVYADLKLAKASNLSDVATATTAFVNIKQDATESVTGVMKLATDAESVTGTLDTVVCTPGNLTARLAAPGTIGGTTPGDGKFADLSGQVLLVTSAGNISLSVAQVKGSLVVITSTGTVILPAVTGANGWSALILSKVAAAVHVDPDGSDLLILDGTTLHNGDKASSTGVAGDCLLVINDHANGWSAFSGRLNAWTDGG